MWVGVYIFLRLDAAVLYLSVRSQPEPSPTICLGAILFNMVVFGNLLGEQPCNGDV